MVSKRLLSHAACQERLYARDEDVRGPYFRDQTAIIHCTPFRRLRNKTQVFFAPEHDHVCTRIEHVLHVATIAATICRGLNQTGWELDTELAYAAGLGHDLGHAPFGHSGERILNNLLVRSSAETGRTEKFSHEAHGLRVINLLTNDGKGLNLTRGVRDAIVCHNGERFDRYIVMEKAARTPEEKAEDLNRLPATWEGCIVRYSDKIAYLGRDLEDAVLAGFISRDELPEDISQELGFTNGQIINNLVLDLISHSSITGKIGLSEEKYLLFKKLYDFNTSYIYNHPLILEYETYCIRIVKVLFEHLMDIFFLPIEKHRYDFERVFDSFRRQYSTVYRQEEAPPSRITVDFIAGMTDHYALECYKELVIPRPIPFPGISCIIM